MIPNRTDERDGWKEGRTYVVGHQRPDTDAIASALGYAWFLAATGAQNIVAARAGQLPAQTTFALEHFGCAAPGILSEVAPLFWHITQEQRALARDSPLSEAMEQMAQGHRVVPVLDDEKHPLGVVTPIALARVYAAISRNPGNAAKALSQPCQEVLEEAPTFRARQRISDHRRSLLRSSDDDFLVTDDAGFYLGVAARGETDGSKHHGESCSINQRQDNVPAFSWLESRVGARFKSVFTAENHGVKLLTKQNSPTQTVRRGILFCANISAK